MGSPRRHSPLQGRSACARMVRAGAALALLGLVPGVSAAAAAAGDRAAARAAAAGAPALGASAPCGSGAVGAAVRAAGLVSERIYALEVQSAEVRRDRSQVEHNEPLLLAMSAGEPAAVKRAVTSLVFSGTHIVRLRVSAHGSLVSDVGGPYVLAPVGGSLRLHGRKVGSYLLSVQDDSGYVKLEQRFVGGLVLMRMNGSYVPVEGTVAAPSAPLPEGGPATYHGVGYQVFSFDVRAFPSGKLRIQLLLHVSASAALTCTQVAAAELDRVGQLVWRRFQTVGGPISGFAHELSSLTGGLVYVRSGSTLLAGSTRSLPKLRDSGRVRFHGITYTVASFPAHTGARRVRVYELFRS